MDKLEKQSKNAVIILDRKYNNGLIDAIFCVTDSSNTYSTQKYIYKEKDQRWYTLATSYKFQKYTHGLVNRLLIYDRSFVSDMEKISDSHEKVFIIANNAIFQGPVWCGTELRQIKKRCSNVYFILYYFDIVSSRHSRKANLFRDQYSDVFDLVYTFDIEDADSYNLIYYPLPYAYTQSSITNNLSNSEKKELTFCANIKKRSGLILELLKGCKQNNVSVSMALLPNNVHEKELFSKNDDVVLLKHFINYDETLKHTLNAECILDIVQDGQTALSMRPYEAVVFNKKLLTNNPSILDFKFYNPDYMQYFSNPKGINWEWVKKKTEVDYGYQGEFSPVNLWKDIENRIS